MEQLQGIICNLERFATHDGPGIRTTVFTKGCPLNCVWCSSPHTRNQSPEILYSENRCGRSGACAKTCPEDALKLSDEGLQIDRDLCTTCGDCIEVCTSRALEITGESMTVEELFREVDKDSSFYRRSSGGVTVSGGELTMQSEFVIAFFKKCKEQYIHTAIETCGLSPWSRLSEVLQYVDLTYFDIKHMDDKAHRKITCASNREILSNAKRVAETHEMVIRVPVVPGHNDSEENIVATSRFAAGLGKGFQGIELLPYHRLGTTRYSQLDMTYELDGLESPDDDHMKWLKDLVMLEGIPVDIVA